MANTTITDTPRRGATEQDRFGIIAYERGLEAFLRDASSPMANCCFSSISTLHLTMPKPFSKPVA